MENDLGRAALDGEWHGALPRYLALAESLQGCRVLELGCGSGAGTRLLWALTDAEIVALDPRPELIQAAQSSAPERADAFSRSAYDPLEAEDDAFDVVLALGGDPLAAITALEEVRRVLRPSGLLILAVPHPGAYDLDQLLPAAEGALPHPPPDDAPAPDEVLGLLSTVFAHVAAFEQRPELHAAILPPPAPSEAADATVELNVAAARARLDLGGAPRHLVNLAREAQPSATLILCSDDPAHLRRVAALAPARIVLPYRLVAASMGRRLSDLHRHLDDLSQTHLLLEGQLEEKARLIDDLEEEVRSQRELARDQAALLERRLAEPPQPSPHAPLPPADDRYVAQLRASAERWESLCLSLQRELELRQHLPAPQAPTPTPPAWLEERDALLAERDALQRQLTAQERAENDQLARALLALAELEERRQQSAALEQRIREQEAEARAFIQEVAATLERAHTQEIQLNKLQEELDRLQSARAKDTLNAQSLEVEIAVRGQKILKLERDLMGKNLEVNSQERENVQLVKRLAERDLELERLRAELNSLNEKLHTSAPDLASRPKRAPRKKKAQPEDEPPA